MNFTAEELDSNAGHLTNAKHLADMIANDPTAGGIFPKGADGDFTSPDIERFKNKYCSWWPLAKKLLTLAKVFTGDKVDAIIDKLIALGDNVCA